MKKISKIIVMLLIVLFVTETTVLAVPINNLSCDRGDTVYSAEQLDSEMEKTLKKIEDNKKEIIKTKDSINSLQKQIGETENHIKENGVVFKNRVRAMYITGFSSYLDIVLNADTFSDFVCRADLVKTIMNKDKKILNDFKNNKEKMEKEKNTFVQKNNSLEKLKEENESKLRKVNAYKQNSKKLLGSSTKKTVDLNAYLQSRDKCIAGVNSIVGYAYGFLGVPYVWGGTTSKGFDCSGFTQHIFTHFGVRIGRTTYDQIKSGAPISKDQLKAGDLVFFGTFTNPHHVGIYVGNNSYIHASHTGDVVKVSNLSGRGDYLTAKRVN